VAMVAAPDEMWYFWWILSFIGLGAVSALRLVGGEMMLRRFRARAPKRNDDDDVDEDIAMVPSNKDVDEVHV
jgi:hypothetical protein